MTDGAQRGGRFVHSQTETVRETVREPVREPVGGVRGEGGEKLCERLETVSSHGSAH